MDLGFNLAQSNRDLKDPTSRQNFGDTSGLLCKNDPILRHIKLLDLVEMTLIGWASGSSDKDAEPCDRNLNLQPERFCNNGQDHKTRMNFQHNLCSGVM